MTSERRTGTRTDPHRVPPNFTGGRYQVQCIAWATTLAGACGTMIDGATEDALEPCSKCGQWTKFGPVPVGIASPALDEKK